MSHTCESYLCYLSLIYVHCGSLFWHAHFPSFIYSVMRCYQTSRGYLFLFKTVLFLEHHFKWSETFECMSYESPIATSTTTLLPSVINMRRCLIYYTSWITVEKLHFQHFLWRGLTTAPSSLLLTRLRKVKTIVFYKLNYHKTHSHNCKNKKWIIVKNVFSRFSQDLQYEREHVLWRLIYAGEISHKSF